MNMKVFAIRDRQLNAFMQPYFAQTAGAAIRAFRDLINEANHPLAKHPEDYELWYLCNWTDDDGLFFHLEGEPGKPQQIAIAANLKETG